MQRHQGSTRNTYHAVWQAFNKFIIRLDQIPKTWEERASLYITHLWEKNTKSSTLKSYLSGIKSVLLDDNYEWKEDKYLFASLTRACRLTNDRVKNRLPIQKGLMHMILDRIEKDLGERQYYLCLLYQCMTILGYYGLLRIGEMAEGPHSVKAKNVHSAKNKEKILMYLFSSKTHGLDRVPQKIKMWADNFSNERHSPFDITNRFSKLRGGYYDDTENYFIYRDRTPVKPANYRKILRKILKGLGLNPRNYDTHSLRIGRATDLMKLGYSVDTIKLLGRWRSNAVFKYIRN